MTFIPLQLPPGIVRGANPDDNPGRWYEANLIRWRDGVMEPVGGWQRINTTHFNTPVRKIHQWRNNTNALRMLVGTDMKLRAYNDGDWTDVTPAGFVNFNDAGAGGGFGQSYYGTDTYGTPRTGPTQMQSARPAWSFANWGEDVLAVASSDGRLLHYSQAAPSTAAAVVATAPTANRSVIVTPERHAMMLQVGGVGNEIGWSSREDYTDWDFASTTNTAGKLPLRTESPLMSQTLVREGVLVWSETEVFLGRYVGLPYIYGFDELGSANLYAPNAFAEFDGRAAWMDQAGFMTYEGGTIRPLPSPLTDYVFSDINHQWGPRNAHAFFNGAFNEVWWFYPSANSRECDRFVVWSYTGDWWSMGKLRRTAGFPAGAGPHPVMASPECYIYNHDTGWEYPDLDDDAPIYIASSTINIAEGEQALHISQLIPSNGSNYDATSYELFTRMTPAQPEVANGPYLARADGYVDTRATGRDVRLRIKGIKDVDWSIGRIRMKAAAGGRR